MKKLFTLISLLCFITTAGYAAIPSYIATAGSQTVAAGGGGGVSSVPETAEFLLMFNSENIDGYSVPNLVSSPFSGTTASNYDAQLGDGSTADTIPYTSGNDYIEFGGTRYVSFTSSGNAAFVEDLNKSGSGKQNFTYAWYGVLDTSVTESRNFFETRDTADTDPGITLYTSGGTNICMQQGYGAARVITCIDTTGSIVDGLNFIIMSHANDMFYVTINGDEFSDTLTFGAETDPSTQVPLISNTDFNATNYLVVGETAYFAYMDYRVTSSLLESQLYSYFESELSVDLPGTAPTVEAFDDVGHHYTLGTNHKHGTQVGDYFIVNVNGTGYAMQFNSASGRFATVGNSVTGLGTTSALCTLNDAEVEFVVADGQSTDTAYVMTFDGVDFSSVGNAFTWTAAQPFTDCTQLDDDIVMIEEDGEGRRLDWDGTDLTQNGGLLTVPSGNDRLGVSGVSATRVVAYDTHNNPNKVYIMDLSGGTWSVTDTYTTSWDTTDFSSIECLNPDGGCSQHVLINESGTTFGQVFEITGDEIDPAGTAFEVDHPCFTLSNITEEIVPVDRDENVWAVMCDGDNEIGALRYNDIY